MWPLIKCLPEDKAACVERAVRENASGLVLARIMQSLLGCFIRSNWAGVHKLFWRGRAALLRGLAISLVVELNMRHQQNRPRKGMPQ